MGDRERSSEFDAGVLDELDELDELDDDEFHALYLKYEFDGADSLEGLSASLRALAAELDGRLACGWALAAPVEGGWVHLRPAPTE